ncbi:SpaA isopeptide-forming pilin-related protein [Schaalia sp. ZJ1691]|uniref:MSCRAMM family protein n=1 Tax=Schaalia sp. ZJ1691 TaxID=2709404 RepID=UPI0013EA3E22|nr:SpaA isopeptide-forming pilin-related protein [Schaalia sp. ZJ1691]
MPDLPSLQNLMKPPGGGGASELALPDADVEAEDFDELELSPLTSLVAFRNTPAGNDGVVTLTSRGELFLANPATGNITPYPPHLPGIVNPAQDKGGTQYVQNSKDRLVRAKIEKITGRGACGQFRSNSSDNEYCYFSRGVNYNALGIGPDGTRFATLKVTPTAEAYADKQGRSTRPIYQVYRLRPGATEWEKFGGEFEFPYAQQPGGEPISDLTFNGGQVAPDGTYYLSITEDVGRANSKRNVVHVYKMSPQGVLQKVGDVYDSSVRPTGVTSNEGDIVFTESGDLVIGFPYHRTDNNPARIPGINIINFEVVTKETLDNARGTTLNSYPLTSVKIRAGEALGRDGEEFAGVTAAKGISIGPDGSLIISDYSLMDSRSTLYSISGNESVRRIDRIFSKWESQATDMAGSAMIPSIKVRKVVADRANTKDQFKVSAQTASITKEATTSGTQKEVSTERIPVLSGTEVTISEAITRSGATLENYDVGLSCSNGEKPQVTINGQRASASIAVKGASGDVVCTFTNTPKADGKVEWAKEDEAGGLLGGSSWRIARRDGVPFTFDGSQNAEKSFVISDATATGGLDKDTDVGKFLLTGLAPGDYTLREETAPEGYQRSGETYTFTMTSPAQEVKKVHLFDGRQPVVGQFGRHNAVRNVPLTGTLLFEKRADQGKRVGNESLLSGSEWTLTNKNTQRKWQVTDCVAVSNVACQGISQDTDSRAGVLRVTGLPLGKYELKEVKAPAGYVLDTTLKSFTIDSEKLDVKFEGEQSIYNTKQAGPTIPLSGGIGRDFFVFLGVGVLGIALLIQLAQRRKRN